MVTAIKLPEGIDPVKVRISLQEETGLSSEGVWCYPVEGEENVYIMGNIPFSSAAPGLGDKFRLNPDETFEILERVSQTGSLIYDIQGCSTEEEIIERYKSTYKHLENNKIQVEGAMAGILSIAIPIDMTDEEVEEILSNCPHLIMPDENGEED